MIVPPVVVIFFGPLENKEYMYVRKYGSLNKLVQHLQNCFLNFESGHYTSALKVRRHVVSDVWCLVESWTKYETHDIAYSCLNWLIGSCNTSVSCHLGKRLPPVTKHAKEKRIKKILFPTWEPPVTSGFSYVPLLGFSSVPTR